MHFSVLLVIVSVGETELENNILFLREVHGTCWVVSFSL